MQVFAWERDFDGQREPKTSSNAPQDGRTPGAAGVQFAPRHRPGLGYCPPSTSRKAHGDKVQYSSMNMMKAENTGASTAPGKSTEPSKGQYQWLAKQLGLSKIMSGAPPPAFKVDHVKVTRPGTSVKILDRLYCKLCSVKMDDDMAYSNHLSSRMHAEVFVRRITELGFTEFDRIYGSNHFDGKLSEFLEEDEYYIPDEYWNLVALRQKWKPLAAEYVYRCAALTNLKCKVCFNVQVRNGHDWWKHIVGHRHSQYAVLAAKTQGWDKYVETNGDVPLLDQQAIQDARKTSTKLTQSTPEPTSIRQLPQPLASANHRGLNSVNVSLKMNEAKVGGSENLGMRVLADAYGSPPSSPVFKQEDEPNIPGWMDKMGDILEPSMPSMFDNSNPSIPGTNNQPTPRDDVIDLTGDEAINKRSTANRDPDRDKRRDRSRDRERNRSHERDRDRGRKRERNGQSDRDRKNESHRSHRSRVDDRDRGRTNDRDKERDDDRDKGRGGRRDKERASDRDRGKGNDKDRDKGDNKERIDTRQQNKGKVKNNKNSSGDSKSSEHQCKECKQVFENSDELVEHENKFKYRCVICFNIYPSLRHYKEHVPINHKTRFNSGWLGLRNPSPTRIPSLRKPTCIESKESGNITPNEAKKKKVPTATLR